MKKKVKKIFDVFMDDEFKKHEEFFFAVIGLRTAIAIIYSLEIPEKMWDPILEAYLKKVKELEK